MKPLPFFIAVALGFTAQGFGQDPHAKAPEDAGFKITGMKCFSDKIINKVEAGKGGFKIEGGFKIGTNTGPGSELEDFTFPETQKKQYFTFDFGAAGAKKKIDVTTKAIKTTLGANQDVITVSGSTDGEGKLPAEWSLKTNWPVGLYKAFFSCEGKPVGTAGYLVKAEKDRVSPIKSKGVTILAVHGGKAETKTKLTPDDNNLIFKCATEGANTKGVKVTMFIGHIDEKGDKNRVPNSEVEIEDWPLEDTTITYTFELEKKFPTGTFYMIYLIDGEELAVHPFTVAAE